jgi:hypothetical protein
MHGISAHQPGEDTRRVFARARLGPSVTPDHLGGPTLSRRGLLRGAAVLGAGLVLPPGTAVASPDAEAFGPPRSSRQRRPLFGALAGPIKYPNVDPTETKADMRARLCAAYQVPRLPVERIFNEATWVVPPAGTPAIVSFTQDPSAVAAGQFDSDITAFVQNLDPKTRYWLCLNHECDQPTRPYTPAQQVAGFRHFSTVARAVGNPNVALACIMMSWTLTQGDDTWRQWYPGPAYVDALGWDAYWRPTLPHSADYIYGPALAVCRAEGKPLLICETSMGAAGHGGQELVGGTYQDIPDELWTAFTAEAIAYLNIADVAAVTWFETNKYDGRWLLEGHSAAFDLWKAAVQNSWR